MGTINVRWTLYRVHDMDLITLEACYRVNLNKILKECLRAFARGEVFVYELPYYENINNQALAKSREYKKEYQKTLTLDEEKDQAVLDIVKRIKEKGRNAFLKMLLRLYLCNPITSYYVEEENLLYLKDKLTIFKTDRTILNTDTNKRKIQKQSKKKKQEVKTVVAKKKPVTQPIQEVLKQKEIPQEMKEQEPYLSLEEDIKSNDAFIPFLEESTESNETQDFLGPQDSLDEESKDSILDFLSSVGR